MLTHSKILSLRLRRVLIKFFIEIFISFTHIFLYIFLQNILFLSITIFYNTAVKPCLLCARYALNVTAEMPGFSLKDHCKSFIQKFSVPAVDIERFCCYSAACVYADVFRQWAYRMNLDFFSVEECQRANEVRTAFVESCAALAKPEWFMPLSDSVYTTEIPATEFTVDVADRTFAFDYNLIDCAVDRLAALFIENIERTGGSVWCFNADFNFLTLVRARAFGRDDTTVNVGALFSAAESSRLPDPSDYPTANPLDSVGS